MALKEKLEELIRELIPNATFELDVRDGRVTGSVVSVSFEEMTHLQRQTKVWDLLREKLGHDSAKVGILLLYTPDEWNALDEEAS